MKSSLSQCNAFSITVIVDLVTVSIQRTTYKTQGNITFTEYMS